MRKVFLVLGAAAAAFGDAGDFAFYNGPLGLADGENAAIAMTAESVTAELGPDGVAVNAEFVFVNRGDEAIKATMYFPLAGGYTIEDFDVFNDNAEISETLNERYGVTLEQPERETAFPLPLKGKPEAPGEFTSTVALTRSADFAVKVGGLPVDGELVLKTYYKKNETGGDTIYKDYFARWEVAFGAGERKTVRCTYTGSYDQERQGSGPRFFIYPLYTGKTWAGAIGEGEVTVRYVSAEVAAPVSFRAPGLPPAVVKAEEGGTEVTWRFAAFEPGEEAAVIVTVATCDDEEGRERKMKEIGLNPAKPGEPAVVNANNLSFRTAPSPEAPRVAGRPTLAKGTAVAVLESRGEWWRVRAPAAATEKHGQKSRPGEGDSEGWIRWRYVDADTGVENVYADFAYEGRRDFRAPGK